MSVARKVGSIGTKLNTAAEVRIEAKAKVISRVEGALANIFVVVGDEYNNANASMMIAVASVRKLVLL